MKVEKEENKKSETSKEKDSTILTGKDTSKEVKDADTLTFEGNINLLKFETILNYFLH